MSAYIELRALAQTGDRRYGLSYMVPKDLVEALDPDFMEESKRQLSERLSRDSCVPLDQVKVWTEEVEA